MKFNILSVAFLASAGLAACDQPPVVPSTPEEAAAAEAFAYDVTCKDATGNITFEGLATIGLEETGTYASPYVKVRTVDGKQFQQYGGTCTALKR
jgi:hypothetical protein